MEDLLSSLVQAVHLLLSGNTEVYQAAWVSIKVSSTAILGGVVCGVPAGFLLATTRFPGRKALVAFFNTLLGLPTVLVGLLLYSFLSRQGPLGSLGWLFTPKAMVLGQMIICWPVLVALTNSAVASVDRRVRPTAAALGAGPLQAAWAVLREARYGLLAATATGFGRIISEVGCAFMVGGNIKGYTRNMTTAIALETSKGEFALGLALGFILVAIAFAFNLLFHYFQRREGGLLRAV